MYPNARTVYIDQLLPINSFLLAHAEDHDGVFPQRLQDVNGYDDMLERVCSFLDHPKDPLKDAWGNEIVYESSGDTFKLISYGRDGVSGGEGLDEDLVFLSRRSIHRHSTLFQFLTNKDQKEIENGPMWNGSFVFSLFPAFLFYFYLLDEHAKNQQIVTMSSMWIFGIVLMVVSLLMGCFIAMLDIPNGH